MTSSPGPRGKRLKQSIKPKPTPNPELTLQTLKEYKQGKEVISKRVYIETMEEVLANTEKIILDTKTAGSVLPYLSLDRIRQSRGGGAQ